MLYTVNVYNFNLSITRKSKNKVYKNLEDGSKTLLECDQDILDPLWKLEGDLEQKILRGT
jgi:hypothetical protein